MSIVDHQFFNPPNRQLSEGDNEKDFMRPKIILRGLKGSGKTSIRKVIFEKMSPNETIIIPPTHSTNRDYIDNSFINLELVEFPAKINFSGMAFEQEFKNCEAYLFIIDAQDDYPRALKAMCEEFLIAFGNNKMICFEVFIHKIDGLQEEKRIDIQRQIIQHVQEFIHDEGLMAIRINYHNTSIYDHSIFEAFSKIIQKLLRQLTALERFLDIFNQGSNIEKSFIFDIASKIYIATDSSPVDMATYELCCDMIDVAIDISAIYGQHDENGRIWFDQNSSAVFSLKTKQVLFLRQINRYLALVCIIRAENYEKEGVIDYNFKTFKNAVYEVFELTRIKAPTAGKKDWESVASDNASNHSKLY
uniref:Ras-related GTP-binding protein D n=1 Tax=Rhabditophanes sp. KR3021 TaxID=114890 RepID=A0AC35TQ21_9BILA